jgi:hypothetical protein
MGTPAEAVQRAFVASYGSDANVATLCGLANPCRSFATAVTVVDPNGEVLALDSIGYGTVTLTQSISLVAAPGVYAGVSVSSGNGVTIATPGISVTLRGLTINGIGGTNGVSMTDGAKLSIENCVISNFAAGGIGVSVITGAAVRIIDSLIRDGSTGVYIKGGATATISGSKIVGNSSVGINVEGFPGSTTTIAAISDTVVANNFFGIQTAAFASIPAVAKAFVTRSTVSNNTIGVNVNGSVGTSVITISNSMVTGNTSSGLQQSNSGMMESLGNNTVRQNGSNTIGTVTLVAPT